MNIELMLIQPVAKLGDPGDVVTVSKGYARNYLIPRGLAAPRSDDVVKRVAGVRKRLEAERAKRVAEAEAALERIANTSVHVEAKAQESGHLYGSVTAAMIVEALAAEGVELEASRVQLEEPIKELGIYEIPVKLYADVVTSVKLYVVAPAPTEVSSDSDS